MADSGVDDASVSPSSSCPDYKPDADSAVSGSLPQSESSAFSKIPKLSTNPDPRYPFPAAAMPMMFPNSGFGYFPTFPMSPWVPTDSLAKCFPSIPSVMSRADANQREVPAEDVFYRVDPRVPFTNYFMNLTKLLKKDEKSPPVSRKESDGYDAMSRDDSDSVSEDDVPGEEEERRSRQSPNHHVEDFKPSMSLRSTPPEHRNMSAMMANPALLCLSQMHPYPPKVSSIESLPHLSGAQTSMIQFMSGMSATPSALIHPAFLHMSALGQKRMNQEKPPPVKKYKCDVCGKAFSRSNTLVTHKVCHRRFVRDRYYKYIRIFMILFRRTEIIPTQK